MKENKPNLLTAALEAAASAQKLGINLIRVAILIIFVWIGGLKFWNYEAEGIVPFVANSPFMNSRRASWTRLSTSGTWRTTRTASRTGWVF